MIFKCSLNLKQFSFVNRGPLIICQFVIILLIQVVAIPSPCGCKLPCFSLAPNGLAIAPIGSGTFIPLMLTWVVGLLATTCMSIVIWFVNSRNSAQVGAFGSSTLRKVLSIILSSSKGGTYWLDWPLDCVLGIAWYKSHIFFHKWSQVFVLKMARKDIVLRLENWTRNIFIMVRWWCMCIMVTIRQWEVPSLSNNTM